MAPTASIRNSNSSVLDEYLAAQKKKLIRFNGESVGLSDFAGLARDIEHVTKRIDAFLRLEDVTNDSHLVLGKIQSGKTAHMLGIVSSLVNTPCTLVVLISGVTGQLNFQTRDRLETDVNGLQSHKVLVRPIPTSTELSGTKAGWLVELKRMVQKRIESIAREEKGSKIGVLPVLAMLEHVKRVEALKIILDELRSDFGDQLSVVIIDDEADQASQNAKANRREKSEIYKYLESIRQSDLKNCLLSYTATPQAVLLTSDDSVLRPRLCSVISAGSQYFGIEDICSEEFSSRLIELHDVPTMQQTAIPSSLKSAFIEFLVVAQIRRRAPDFFYAGRADLTVGVDSDERMSVQMLVHPSGRKADHSKYASWMQRIKEEIEDQISGPNEDFIKQELNPAYERVLRRANPFQGNLPSRIPTDWIEEMSVVLEGNTNIEIVNSSNNEMPFDDQGWSKRKQWILVGGDILGRGVTIPQLVTTYFLRSPKVMNFDTLSQQMRFCGYRRAYRHLVTIFAPGAIIDRFKVVRQTDRILFNYANLWDREETDLHKSRPMAIYVQDGTSNLEPTRRGVLAPNIKVLNKGSRLFIDRKILLPEYAVRNAALLTSLIGNQDYLNVDGNWELYDLARSQLELMFKWRSRTRGFADVREVFDPKLEELGLSGCDLRLAVRGTEGIRQLGENGDPEALKKMKLGVRSFRTQDQQLVKDFTSQSMWSDWSNRYLDPSQDFVPEWITDGEIEYIGGGQRKLQSEVGSNTVLFIVEPLRIRKSPLDDGTVAIALELAIVAPKGYSVSFWVTAEDAQLLA